MKQKQISTQDARMLLLEAISEANRLRILDTLVHRGEATVGELVEELGIDQPGVSHHLRCLRNCGLVQSRKDGRFMWYRLNGAKRVERFLALLDQHAADHLEEILGCEIVGEGHNH